MLWERLICGIRFGVVDDGAAFSVVCVLHVLSSEGRAVPNPVGIEVGICSVEKMVKLSEHLECV